MLMIEGNLHFDEVLKRIIKIEIQNGLTWTTWKMFYPRTMANMQSGLAGA